MSELKTVSQFAAVAGVSVQTIYRQLNNVKKVKQFSGESLTERKAGKLHITAFGEGVLRERLTGVKQDVKQVKHDVKQVKHLQSEEIAYLREQNRTLQEELTAERTHSREQADKLADLAARLADLSRNNQLLLGAEQTRTNPALLPSPKQPGLLKRLFGRKA